MRNQFFYKGKKMDVGVPMTDELWDSYLPKKFQSLSSFQWTPIPVIERTWKYLSLEKEVTSLVDLGSGVGKFCIYLSILANRSINILGLEDREELVDLSLSLKALWNTPEVNFKNINFLDEFPYGHSHYYCFNPLYETMKGSHSIDSTKIKSANQFLKDLEILKRKLYQLNSGTKLITFHGFGGSFLDGFRIVLKEEIVCGEFLVWERE
ncbi:methyltransferase [Leptospira bandrabouensis]|uniref:methyltransferase n=1 Tax=Leptospira bandrabouensis TaxID=2484903 RepID=UPI001EE97075|nr:methyltransferase [Leptospira bandrabouensis]MCG6144795.1 methyltransferase [Leptospira bandrabouensis]MCG6160568.1 methyltransferase [Leptospira bandrabouensis]MCG6164500.1 methyltransferase [Leptospira bandrabouensis]